MNTENNTNLSEEQLESLKQYANACKMRPATYPDEWRDVPTNQKEFDESADKNYWLQIANTF